MTDQELPHPLRRIRSFVRREGRITAAQQRALQDEWPRFGLDASKPLDFAAIFGRQAPVTLEIGFGNGESLATMAANEPQQDFVGIEVHRPGIGQLLQTLAAEGISNVRVLRGDAVEILEQGIADASLDRVLLFFPDPWHKKRHHKRRIVRAEFIALLARKLRPGGRLHMATDWEDYAEQMLAVVSENAAFRNLAGDDCYVDRPAERPVTKFERRGQRLGHGVWDLVFERVG